MKYYLGVDLGGTNIVVGIVDETGAIVAKASTPTSLPRPDREVVDSILILAKKVLADNGKTLDDIEWVGVGCPGSVDLDTGIVTYSNNLNWFNTPLKNWLRAGLGKDVYLDNDANAAAYGEYLAGAAKGANTCVMITLGTGVGGGIIIDGKVYRGFNYAGAELGHIVIEKDGRQCSCGRRGCWEAYSSATGLVNITKDRVLEAKAAGRESSIFAMIGDDLSKISARTAFTAQKEGDALGAEIVDEYISYLACGIVNVINIFQPNVLSIGGGVCNEGENLTRPLLEKVFAETYSREGTPRTEIKIAALGNDAGIIGAAVLGK